MSWTGPAELRQQVLRLWEHGVLLREALVASDLFPLKLKLRAPSAADLASRYADVRAWIQQLRMAPFFRVEWREVNHRVIGANSVPCAVWLDSFADAIGLLAVEPEVALARALYARLVEREPLLVPWLLAHPFEAIALGEVWQRLLDIVAWVREHPRPAIYLRQVDIPGVHTKLIELHRETLRAWLDLTLPADVIDPTKPNANQFAERYGFLEKPRRVRFRCLDPQLLPALGLADVTLDLKSFAALRVAPEHVFITENEINFLALPLAPMAMVVFGEGYGVDALSGVPWLSRTPLHYWGDIDTHGFAILDRLRAYLPRAQSLLMDEATLFAHERAWGEEHAQYTGELTRLSPQELALFNALRDNRIRPKLRLEQERIGFAWLEDVLKTLVC